MLLMFALLTDKINLLEERIQPLGFKARQDFIRRLHILIFTQYLSRQHIGFLRLIIDFIIWTTIGFIPLVLLLWAQITFLPAQEQTIVWSQRVCIFIDTTLVIYFWNSILQKRRRSLLPKDWRLPVWRAYRASGWLLVTLACIGFLFSFIVAVIPIGSIEESKFLYKCRNIQDRDCDSFIYKLTSYIFDDEDQKWPERRLIVSDDIVTDNNLTSKIQNNLLKVRKQNAYWIDRDNFIKKDTAWKDTEESITGINLNARILRFSDLRYTVLPYADLRKAKLQGANLSNADLRGANLSNADLRGADMEGAVLQEADLRNADFQTANLAGAHLQGANLSSTHLEGADFYDSVLSRSVSVDLRGADLSKAHLQGADLQKAQLRGVNLSETNLQGANLSNANLQGANLTYANLQGAYLGGAHLEGADLSGANLQGADVSDAQLQRADFSRALLHGANLYNANIDFTMWGDIAPTTASNGDWKESDYEDSEWEENDYKSQIEELQQIQQTLNSIDLENEGISRIERAIDRIKKPWGNDLIQITKGSNQSQNTRALKKLRGPPQPSATCLRSESFPSDYTILESCQTPTRSNYFNYHDSWSRYTVVHLICEQPILSEIDYLQRALSPILYPKDILFGLWNKKETLSDFEEEEAMDMVTDLVKPYSLALKIDRTITYEIASCNTLSALRETWNELKISSKLLESIKWISEIADSINHPIKRSYSGI
jgi:uncharacterized protein YjbI with pentapeptide repeats